VLDLTIKSVRLFPNTLPEGIGGLGHLAIQFAAKSGFNTVALSQSDSKKDLALKLGAHHYISGDNIVGPCFPSPTLSRRD
jgi:D-arabinose 1-dehydrogenase-like Zn-dependent alcohol dehydrogenase